MTAHAAAQERLKSGLRTPFADESDKVTTATFLASQADLATVEAERLAASNPASPPTAKTPREKPRQTPQSNES